MGDSITVEFKANFSFCSKVPELLLIKENWFAFFFIKSFFFSSISFFAFFH